MIKRDAVYIELGQWRKISKSFMLITISLH